MPRRIRSSTLETRTARLKLPKQRKPFWVSVAPGISLGYRRLDGAGSWNVRCADGNGGNWVKSFGVADDHENADGANVMDFWQAADKARSTARGQDGSDAGKPITVAKALDDYAADLKVRGASPTNASWPRYHLTPALLAATVSTLTVRELRHWRNGLAEAMPASTVNRICKSVKACLNLAAHDDRIVNAKSWRIGLGALPEADDTESNLVLSDQQRRDVIAAAYKIGAEFGLYVEVHAATGARSSQIHLLDVGDLHVGKEPKLLMPSSLKGRNRRTRTKKPLPISPGLAQRLKQAAAGRDADQPLLLRAEGDRWRTRAHHDLFVEAARAAGLPPGASIYALRHSAITWALLAGVPIRLIASSCDTSVAMIEKTYSKYIADHGDAQMRKALLDLDAPAAAGNVVPLAR